MVARPSWIIHMIQDKFKKVIRLGLIKSFGSGGSISSFDVIVVHDCIRFQLSIAQPMNPLMAK
jgi:hypothetical protein